MSTDCYAASGLTVYVAYRPIDERKTIVGLFSNKSEVEEYVRNQCEESEDIRIEPYIVDDEL